MSTEILHFVTEYSLYTGCTIIGLGVIGNALNILVFTQLRLFRENRCAFYVIIESISNFLYQFISISLTILTSIYGDDATGRSSIWCKFRYIFAQTLVLTTASMICLTAVDQFFSTNYRFNLREICTLKLGRCLTFAFVVFWIVHSIVFGMSFDVQPSLGCVISNPSWLQYSTYFFYPVLAGILPVIIASLFSILAFRNVRRIVRRQLPIVRRRLDRQMTAMVLMRVIFFVGLVFPYLIYRVYALSFPISRTKPMEYAIGRLVQAIFLSFGNLNYSVSFYIFVISSARFRRQVKFVLVKSWQRCKSCCCLGQNQIAPQNIDPCGGDIELEENV